MRLKVIPTKSRMKYLIIIIYLISHNHFLYTVYHLYLLETTSHLQKPHFSTHKPIKPDIATAKQWNNDIPFGSPKLKPQKLTKHYTSLVTKPSSSYLWLVFQKLSLLHHENDQHSPFWNILFYLKP